MRLHLNLIYVNIIFYNKDFKQLINTILNFIRNQQNTKLNTKRTIKKKKEHNYNNILVCVR